MGRKFISARRSNDLMKHSSTIQDIVKLFEKMSVIVYDPEWNGKVSRSYKTHH